MSETSAAFCRGCAAIPVRRSPRARRQGLGRLARFLCAGRRVLDAVLDDDDKLITDPQSEVSLIYYAHRGGLEDRVFRIRTERSSATSLPEPRTSHNISNVEIVEQTSGECRLRFNWVTFSFRYKTVDTYFGTSFYTLDTSAARPLIKRKKVILKNDYIHHVVNIYQI